MLHERLASLSNPLLRPRGILDGDGPGKGSNNSNPFEYRPGDFSLVRLDGLLMDWLRQEGGASLK